MDDHQRDAEAERALWCAAHPGFYTGAACANCNRVRVYLCANGKHRCEKCNWVPEMNAYGPDA